MPTGMPLRYLGAGLAVWLFAGIVACTPSDDSSTPVPGPLGVEGRRGPFEEPSRPNFVFILIDTLRADHLGAYGYPRDTTPFIDSLAANGLLFESAVSQAPWTGASMASIWTSRFPSEVGAGVLPDESGQRWLGKSDSTELRTDVPTVAEVLGGVGYRSMALVSNSYAAEAFGLLRGYDVTRKEWMDAGDLTKEAISLLAEHHHTASLAGHGPGSGKPFFLYIHYIDVHEPTFPPEEYRQRFPASDGEAHGKKHSRWNYGYDYDPEDPDFQSFREHKIGLYDAALRYIDDQIQYLAGYLESKGLLDRTVFIIASDHGEEFWDHKEFERNFHLDPRGLSGVGHGQSLFGELTDVPLIISGPNVPSGRISKVVRNIDLVPTMYALAGVDTSDLKLHGIDLIDFAQRSEPFDLDAVSESISYGVEAKSIQRGRWKLIRYFDTKGDQKEFLYNRELDAAEQTDLLLKESEIAAQLGAALDVELAEMERGPRGAKTELDDQMRTLLKAIGYIE